MDKTANNATTAARESLSGAATILAIDNDPVALLLASRTLEREGFRLVTATSGAEGLRLARTERPAAIILDVEMPGMDGWAVLTALKTDPSLAAIPVILVTMVDERKKGIAMGASDYLLKPIDRVRLGALLKKFAARITVSTALVVEDDPANRELLARQLRREGWSVIETDNGQTALELARACPPNLVLLDLMLPGLNGFALMDEFRKDPALQAVPIVVVSAKELSREERRQLSTSVRRVLQKGAYSRDDLVHEIRTQLAAPVHTAALATARI